MDIDLVVLLVVAMIAFVQFEVRVPLVSNEWTKHTAATEMQRPPPAPVEVAVEQPLARPARWAGR